VDGVERTQGIVRALQAALYRFEGSVNKLSVDEKGVTLVAALGLPPLTHEDDPTRGVLAALAMQAALRGMDVRNAIGITTGRVYCGEIGSARRREYTLMGDVVNLAARLMQAADGGMLCDAATFQAAHRHIKFDAHPPLTVKGKAEPVASYRPLGQVAEPRATGSLVGRAAERDVLTERLTALELGDGGVLVMEGEAGIGKSRLVVAVAEEALGRGMAVLPGTGDAIERTTPYHLWRPVFAQLLGVNALSDTQARRVQALTFLQEESELLRLAPLLNDVLALDLPENELTSQMTGQIRADNTHELLLGLLQLAVRKRRTVLVLEDAHWFDSASWALTTLVAARVKPLLMVLASRPPAEPVPLEYQRLLNGTGVRKLPLQPLPPEDSIALVCYRLGVATLPQSVSELLRRKAQGNPFFTEELAYALRDAGLVLVEDGRCRVAPGADLDAAAFPDNVHGLITSRLDRLPPGQQLTMKVASVIGYTFAFRILRDVFPVQPEKDHLTDHLTPLERLNLVQLETPDPNLAYLFKHVLIQEAAYGLLLFAQRRELHRTNAEWYEQTFGEDLAPYFPLLAHHWGKAEVTSKAIDYLEKAGEQAMREGAYKEAQASFRHAVRLADAARAQGCPAETALRRARWHRQIGYACVGLGQPEEARSHLESAVEQLGFPVPQSRWRFRLSLLRQGLVQVLRRAFSRGIPSSTADPKEPLLEAAIAYCALTEVYYWANDPWLILFASLLALNLSERVGLSPALGRSYATVGFSAAHISLHSLAAIYRRLAMQTARVVRDRAALAFVMVCNAPVSALAGHWEDVESDCLEGLESANAIDDRRRGAQLLILQSWAAGCQARFQRSIEAAREFYSRACRCSDIQSQLLGLLNEAESLLPLGRLEEVLSLLERASPLLSQNARVMDQFWATGLLAVARLRRGEGDAARTAADTAINLLPESKPAYWGPREGMSAPAEVYLSLWECRKDLTTGIREFRTGALKSCSG
jgi:tetratricopeptide (TPR) repeat protein